jgi:hypothetical protein
MLKTNLSDIFSDLNSESSVILPKSIKIKNINSVDTVANTTSSFMPQKGAYSDATSSFMPQKGGYLNGTKNKDIQQLISMLSATSHDNYTANSTDNTEQLKDKLFNIIQSGGSERMNEIIVEITPILRNIESYQTMLINTDNANHIESLKQTIKKKLKTLENDAALTFLETFAKIYIKPDLTNELITKPYLLNLLGIIKYVIFTNDETGMLYQNKLLSSISQSLTEITNKSNPTNMNTLYENHKILEDDIKKKKLYNYYDLYFQANFKDLQDYNSRVIQEYTPLPTPRPS